MELIVGNPIVERVGQRYAQISSDWVLPSTTRHMPSQSESSTYAVIGFMDADDNNKMGNASNFKLVLNVAVDAVWRLRTCVTSDDFAAGISFTQRKKFCFHTKNLKSFKFNTKTLITNTVLESPVGFASNETRTSKQNNSK